MDNRLLFEVETPLNFTVRCSVEYWQRLVLKHPAIAERLEDVKHTLTDPDEVRLSSSDAGVLLFYRADTKRWLCAVARKLNGEGFLITSYPTDAVKQGEVIWRKNSE